MNIIGNLIGIDVSKDTIDCCLLIHNEPYYHEFKNNKDGFYELLKISHDFKVISIGFESTGNYHKKLEKYLFGNGVKPYVLNPLTMSNFAKTLKIHGKTDKTDSYAIAQFLLKGDLTPYLSYPIRESFKPITTSLILVEKQIRQTNNLIHSLDLLPETNYVKNYLVDISDNLKSAKIKMRDDAVILLYEKCPEAKKIKDDIKGVGDNLLIFLIPYLYDNFDKFTLKQINAFFGLNPVSFQSGTSVNKKDKLSKKGDKKVMVSLFMSSISAIKTNEVLKEKYARMKDKGKPSKVALVSVMSHLLRAIVIKLSHYTKRPYKK